MAKAQAPRAPRRSATQSPDVDLESDKLYFKIGEVSEIVGVAPYVLRYWETEFKAIRPAKSRSQQRVYRRRDVVTLLQIKHLLYQQKFTIAGARKQLREAPRECVAAPPDGVYLARQSLAKVRALVEESLGFCASWATLDRAAADPAAFVADAGGARALLDDIDDPQVAARPERRLRSPT